MGQAEPAGLIAGSELKSAAQDCLREISAKIKSEQRGLPSVFDSWFTRALSSLARLDPGRSWEDSVHALAAQQPAQSQSLLWDLQRLRQYLDRRRQGRFVSFESRERSGRHYYPRFGTEFGPDVLLTCQGAPSLMRWRGEPLMKNVFDFALYPALIAELRPLTVFEIGSGSGASAALFADNLAFCEVDGHVHSVDLVKAQMAHPRITFHQGDCHEPGSLFDPALLSDAPHPWLVVEDAHQNVAGVLRHFHAFMRPGDYLVVEDSDVKRDVLRQFSAEYPGVYLVDTRFTDYFGRNATCAADSIFVRAEPAAN